MINLEEIKVNAPEGATHYDERKDTYYKQSGRDLWKWIGKWLYMSNCRNAEIFVLGMRCIKYINPYN